MKTISRRIFFLLALFVSINVSGTTYSSMWYQPGCQHDPYNYQPAGFDTGAEENNAWITPFSSSDGMGGLPGDPGSNGGGMGDLPGDPGANLPIKNDWYAFLILGLGYGVFVYIRKEKQKCNFKETQS